MKVIERRRRRLNIRLLLGLLVVVIGTAAGLHFLRTYRLGQAVSRFRDRGLAARKFGNHRNAAEELGRYVSFVPDDTEGLRAYVRSLEQLGDSQELIEQVFSLNEEIVRREPEDMQIRAKQTELALRLSRLTDAAAHLKTIEKYQDLDAKLWIAKGRCAEADRRLEDAVNAFETARRLDPGNLEAADRLSQLFSEQKKDDRRAREVLDTLVRERDDADALILRARWAAARSLEEVALEDLSAAVKLAPDDNVAIVAFASATLKQLERGSADEKTAAFSREARFVLEREVEQAPDDPTLRLYLSRLLWAAQDATAALDVLRIGHRRNPTDQSLVLALTDLLVTVGETNAARELLKKIPATPETRASREFLEARILIREERWVEAQSALQQLLLIVPPKSRMREQILLCQAECFRASKNPTEAKHIFENAVAQSPESRPARLGLAELHLQADNLLPAIHEYRKLRSIPRVNAFLADLLIEHNLRQPPDARRWEEIEKLLDRRELIGDPVEIAVLRADLSFARRRPDDAWKVLKTTAALHPESRELALAMEQATLLLLDQVAAEIESDAPDSASAAAFRLVIDDWAETGKADKLAVYLSQYTKQGGDRDTLLTRMRRAVLLGGQIAGRLEARSGGSAAEVVRDFVLSNSAELLQLDPNWLPNHVQLLAANGLSEEALGALKTTQSDASQLVTAAAMAARFLRADGDALDEIDEVLKSAASRGADEFEVRQVQAGLLSLRGRHDESIALHRRLLTEQPGARGVALNLAWLEAVHRRQPLDAGVFGGGREAWAQDVKACISIAKNDFAAAERILESAISQNSHPSYLVHLSYVKYMLRKEDAARDVYRRIAEAGISGQHLHPLNQALLKQLKNSLSL